MGNCEIRVRTLNVAYIDFENNNEKIVNVQL